MGKLNHGKMIRDGIARAKERGVSLGRPDKIDYDEFARILAENSTKFHELDEDGYTPKTEHEIMAMAGVKSGSTMKHGYDYLRAAMEKDEWPYSWPKPVQVRKMPLYDRVIKRMRGGA